MTASMSEELTLGIDGDAVKILFGGIIHVAFRYSSLRGIQSWVSREGRFCIEYYLVGQRMLCEYDSREKWLAILGLLDKAELFVL